MIFAFILLLTYFIILSEVNLKEFYQSYFLTQIKFVISKYFNNLIKNTRNLNDIKRSSFEHKDDFNISSYENNSYDFTKQIPDQDKRGFLDYINDEDFDDFTNDNKHFNLININLENVDNSEVLNEDLFLSSNLEQKDSFNVYYNTTLPLKFNENALDNYKDQNDYFIFGNTFNFKLLVLTLIVISAIYFMINLETIKYKVRKKYCLTINFFLNFIRKLPLFENRFIERYPIPLKSVIICYEIK